MHVPIDEIVKIIGYLSTLFGVIVWFSKKFNEFAEDFREIKNSQLCQLRSDIASIYYKHVDEEVPTLREYERKNLDDLYGGYHTMNGNHFIDDIYAEMRSWKVIT